MKLSLKYGRVFSVIHAFILFFHNKAGIIYLICQKENTIYVHG